MDDLKFKIEIDGTLKEALIVFSYYYELKDQYYIIFEVEDQEDYEAAILVSKSDDEVILEDIETEEEWERLLKEYDAYLDKVDNLKDETNK